MPDSLSDFLLEHATALCVVCFGLVVLLLVQGLSVLPRRRGAVLLTAGILFAAGVAGVLQLGIDDSPERWMPTSSVDAWTEFDRHFSHSDTIGIAAHFTGRLRDEDVKYLDKIRQELKQVPGVVRVIDMAHSSLKVEETPLTDILREPKDRDDDPFAMYRGILFEDPKQWRDDYDRNADLDKQLTGRTLIYYIELDTGQKSVDSGRTAAEEHERRANIVREFNRILSEHARDDVEFHVAGAIVIQSELEQIARGIVRIFVPLSILLAFVALGTAFRSFSPVLLAVTAAVWSTTVLLGGVAWAGWSLNVVTVGVPTLMFVIVIATAVHFAHAESSPYLTLEHVPDGNTADGKPVVHSRTDQFVRWVGIPCLGAAATTGVGFLMLAFNELIPIREMGVELYFGAVLAFLGVFLMWLWIPRGRPVAGRWLRPDRLRALNEFLNQKPLVVIGVMCVMMVVLGLAATRIEIDADPFSFFKPESKMARSLRHISRRRFGMYLLDIALVPKQSAGSGAGELTDEQRKAVDEFTEKIAKRPEVRNVVSTRKFKAQQQRIGASMKKFDINSPEARRLDAFRKTFDSWLHDKADEGALRITFKVDDLGDGFGDLMQEVRRELPTEHFECTYTGTAADIIVLAEGLLGGMIRGLGTAFVVMAVVCFVWFRSVRLTLIAFLPNVFPVLFVLGIMGAFDVPLNSGTAMVATIALGVALNDTMHFLMHYRGRRLEGEGLNEAIADTYAEIGRPIILTSIVNCVGFSIFLLSDFRPMSDFGLLTGLAMMAALAGDLILLPSLLKVFDIDTRRSKREEPVDEAVAQA